MRYNNSLTARRVDFTTTITNARVADVPMRTANLILSNIVPGSRIDANGDSGPATSPYQFAGPFGGLLEGSSPIARDEEVTPSHEVSAQAQPSSSFERMRSFRPAIYTSRPATRILICHDAFQVPDFTRVTHCTLFYSPAPNEWIRLTVRISVDIESPWWKFWNAKPENDRPTGHVCPNLPKAILNGLGSALKAVPDLEQDFELSTYLGHSGFEFTGLGRKSHQVTKDMQEMLTTRVRHLGCRPYQERSLDRQYLTCRNFIGSTLRDFNLVWICTNLVFSKLVRIVHPLVRS